MVNKHESYESIEDEREFCVGDVWKVRDELVTLLPSDRVNNKRNFHPCRLVVITQNCIENNNKFFPVVQVAPLSTTIKYKQKFDIELNKGVDIFDTNADQCMLQMQLEQPMLKKDLFEKVGYISEDKRYEIIVVKAELMGLDLGDEEDEVEE